MSIIRTQILFEYSRRNVTCFVKFPTIYEILTQEKLHFFWKKSAQSETLGKIHTRPKKNSWANLARLRWSFSTSINSFQVSYLPSCLQILCWNLSPYHSHPFHILLAFRNYYFFVEKISTSEMKIGNNSPAKRCANSAQFIIINYEFTFTPPTTLITFIIKFYFI